MQNAYGMERPFLFMGSLFVRTFYIITLLLPEVIVSVDVSDKQRWYLDPYGTAGVWNGGITGRGVTIGIVDMDFCSDPTLELNYNAAASKRIFPGRTNVCDTLQRRHGLYSATTAAGKRNGVCGLGIAYDASIVEINYLYTDATGKAQYVDNKTLSQWLIDTSPFVDIYSNSYGAGDTGSVFGDKYAFNWPAFASIVAKKPRTLVVWAAGNGGLNFDTCSYEGILNEPAVLPIAGITGHYRPLITGEACSGLIGVTFSTDSRSSLNERIHAWGGKNECHDDFSASSAAAPAAAGILALVKEANPRLTWIDVQHILAYGSLRDPKFTISLPTSCFTVNKAGISHSEGYGFGLLSASRLVDLARKWVLVPSSRRHLSLTPVMADKRIWWNKTYTVDASTFPVKYTEHVLLSLYLTSSRGDKGPCNRNTRISIISPENTKSVVLRPRRNDYYARLDFSRNFIKSYAFWGEDPRGIWKIEVTKVSDDGCVFPRSKNNSANVITLTLWGISDTATLPLMLKERPPPLPKAMSCSSASGKHDIWLIFLIIPCFFVAIMCFNYVAYFCPSY